MWINGIKMMRDIVSYFCRWKVFLPNVVELPLPAVTEWFDVQTQCVKLASHSW